MRIGDDENTTIYQIINRLCLRLSAALLDGARFAA
jgi:hypothetical protein